MADNKPTNFEIVKSLFPTTPATWDSRINLDGRQYWDAAKTLISDDNFSPIRNQIFNALINRIALTKIRHQNFTNPLAMFKKGYMPYGDTMQEISVDVSEAQQYKTGNAPQFDLAEPTVRAAYHRVNRQQFYKKSVYDVQLQYAFTQNYGLSELVNEIISSLQSSNVVDEYIYTKKLISSYLTNTEFPLQESQRIKVPSLTNDKRTQNDILKAIESIKKVMYKVQFPNRDYNSSNQMAQATPAELVLILNSDIMVINEVNNLSSAFNPQFLNLNVPIIAVDEIDKNNPNLIGAIVSRSAFDIRTTREAFAIAENAEALYTNYIFHIHQIYTASPFETFAIIEQNS